MKLTTETGNRYEVNQLLDIFKINDLWIAATASVLDAALLTTDIDFEHLDEVFLKLKSSLVR